MGQVRKAWAKELVRELAATTARTQEDVALQDELETILKQQVWLTVCLAGTNHPSNPVSVSNTRVNSGLDVF